MPTVNLLRPLPHILPALCTWINSQAGYVGRGYGPGSMRSTGEGNVSSMKSVGKTLSCASAKMLFVGFASILYSKQNAWFKACPQ